MLDHLTFQQEHFHPTINQTADGTIRLVAGFQQGTILRLDGWESVHRHDFGSVVVSEKDLEAIRAMSVQSSRKEGRPRGTIAIRANGPTIDGDLSDWPGNTQWLRIDERASAAILADSQNLYVAFRTFDPHALENAGGDYRYLFKAGGALDLMLGTSPHPSRQRHEPAAGDLRLLVTRIKGKTAAVLYRPVLAKGAGEKQAIFQSPVGKVIFDDVRDISDQVKLAGKEGNYEFSVPLKVLGFSAAAGEEVVGDVGVLRGNEGRTMQRVYWSNTNTTIVSDLPSEARLQPAQWGLLKIKGD